MRSIGKREGEQLYLLTLRKLRKRKDLKRRLKISITSSLPFFLFPPLFPLFFYALGSLSYHVPSHQSLHNSFPQLSCLLARSLSRCRARFEVASCSLWSQWEISPGLSRNTTPPFVLHALEDILFLLSGWVSRCRLRSQFPVPILFPKAPHETFQRGIIKWSLPTPNFY